MPICGTTRTQGDSLNYQKNKSPHTTTEATHLTINGDANIGNLKVVVRQAFPLAQLLVNKYGGFYVMSEDRRLSGDNFKPDEAWTAAYNYVINL